MYIVSIIIGAVEMVTIWAVTPLIDFLATSLFGLDANFAISLISVLVAPTAVVFGLLNAYKKILARWPKIDKSATFIGVFLGIIFLFWANSANFQDLSARPDGPMGALMYTLFSLLPLIIGCVIFYFVNRKNRRLSQ